MDLLVREARPAEYPAIADLTVDAYRTIDPELGSYEARIRDVAGRASVATVLAASLDGRVIGTVTYVGDSSSPLSESEDPADAGVRLLAVAPDAMGRGAGTALVERCIELARAHGRGRLVLLTRPAMHAAHAIYARLGFVRAPELDERWEEVILLGFARELQS